MGRHHGSRTARAALRACFGALFALFPPSFGPALAETATATNAVIEGDAKRTSFRLDLSAGVTAEIYTLANPYRVIVDLPDVGFALPEATGKTGAGLVTAFRYGLFAEKKSRIVLDTAGPVRVERAAMTAVRDGKGLVFTFDVVATAAESFGQGTGANRTEPHPPVPSPDPEKAAKAQSAKPIVMIDPGHGGIDGGATGSGNMLEKKLVLEVAKELKAALDATGRYDVRMTRTKDVFISLDQRLIASLQNNADLFISLHADSIAGDAAAQSVRGATVYTLSERASDEGARRMAEKENASDAAAGLAARDIEADEQVKSILIDLMKRETANFSSDFSNMLIRELKRTIGLSRDPKRAAAFKVLKQTHSPSVLIELGYLSNIEDEQLMTSPAWQKKAAASITNAVNAYFASRSAHAQ